MKLLQDLTVFLWLVTAVFWLAAAVKTKAQLPQRSAKDIAQSEIILFGTAIVVALLYRLLPVNFRSGPLGHNTTLQVAGFAVFLVGEVLAIWARTSIGSHWGMPMSTKRDTQLVTRGPYSLIRHPIYTAILVMMLGSMFVFSGYWIIVFITAATYFTYGALQEEKHLTATLPAEYPAYRRRTKMFIPFVL